MNKFFKHCKKVDIYIGLVVVAITLIVMVLTGDLDFDSEYNDFWELFPLALALGVIFAIALELIILCVRSGIEANRISRTCEKCGAFDSYEELEPECIDERDVERLEDRDSRGYPCQPFYIHGKEYTFIYRWRCKNCGNTREYEDSETHWNGW
ncbi:MAG: hypothetical protein IJ686_02210 [Bacteroidales bacterium]|nr:hypothetical protein [Bacteroidales bacterium]